jgi:hypothetical protein
MIAEHSLQNQTPPEDTANPGGAATTAPLLTNRLYDRQDMLQLFHISARTLQYWRKKGILKFVRIEGKIYYPQQFVEEMLQTHLVKKGK